MNRYIHTLFSIQPEIGYKSVWPLSKNISPSLCNLSSRLITTDHGSETCSKGKTQLLEKFFCTDPTPNPSGFFFLSSDPVAYGMVEISPNSSHSKKRFYISFLSLSN